MEINKKHKSKNLVKIIQDCFFGLGIMGVLGGMFYGLRSYDKNYLDSFKGVVFQEEGSVKNRDYIFKFMTEFGSLAIVALKYKYFFNESFLAEALALEEGITNGTCVELRKDTGYSASLDKSEHLRGEPILKGALPSSIRILPPSECEKISYPKK